MPAQDTAVDVRPSGAAQRGEQRPHTRLLHGMRRPANWLQLIRFAMVGGTGFVLNLGVYALCVHVLHVAYQPAYAVAWLVGVTNNFVLNRHWTFDASAGQIHFQAVRFFTVSLLAAAFGLLLLTLFVEVVGLAKVPAEAFAVAAATPLNFLGNKLWSFRVRP
ncbi:MAG TPA: GtrA family protein [Solirubrobacteraceae bacterium]|nr:GtrA family protein [Solirubrobacteraceae bacterium]